jgi:polyhydroxyalkanoate synthesis regulator phasin
MADEKPNQDKKPTAEKAGAKKAAASKAKSKKAGATKTKKASKSKSASAKSSAKKAAPKSAPNSSSKRASARSTVGLDKSIAQLKDSLEHSVTLSRDRIQEVVDDAVKRGRMTHGDAEKMIGELLKRGRKQTDALLTELEKLVRQARRKLP